MRQGRPGFWSGWLATYVATLAVVGAATIGSATAWAETGEGKACPNQAFRSGPSADLPDCRAYELVTPPDTNGRQITAAHYDLEINSFATELASPSGNSFLFSLFGQPLAEFPESNGVADTYESVRTSNGWRTVRRLSPSGAEAVFPNNGGISPDHRYIFENVGLVGGTESGGSLAEEEEGNYLGNPDGSFELIGIGSLGAEPGASGRWITADGTHVVFTTECGSCERKQLEPAAPPSGVAAIYDRSADGPTHVVSLLPNEVTPAEQVRYQGTAADGTAVAFFDGETLYVRVDNSQTEEVVQGEAVFAGLSADGAEVFYMLEGDPYAFDVNTETIQRLTSTHDVELVNVSPDGSRVYFVSFSQLDGSSGTAGEPNLYVWHAGDESIDFIGTVGFGDISGFPALNTWTNRVVASEGAKPLGPGTDSSRLTPDGSIFLFESEAKLTDYENNGHNEIYRYDDSRDSLLCVSCNPDAVPTADARLENFVYEPQPAFVSSEAVIHNLSADGGHAFFETSEALVGRDVDAGNDIYEWSEGAPALSLISSGQTPDFPGLSPASAPNVLTAITPDGSNVFFNSVDALVPGAGVGGVPASYDARVNGGFASVGEATCRGEACQATGETRGFAPPGSSTFSGHGNVRAGKSRCARSRHRAHRRARRGCRRAKHRKAGRKPTTGAIK
jgi:hypothetical protein